MKNRKFIIGIIAVLLAAAVGIYMFFGREKPAEGEGVYVESVSVMCGGNVLADRYAGTVESQETLDIKKDSSRQIEELYVKAGDTVIIDSPLFKYDVREAQNGIVSTNLNIEGINNEISALNAEINDLVKERNKVSNDEKLDYTTQIQAKQMQIRQNEYELQQKKADIDKYQKEIDNAVVRSTITGVVKQISENGYDNMGNELPYISITQVGEYRVKGKVDETSIGTIVPGMNVIIRSRVNEEETWTGMVAMIDTEPAEDRNNYYYGEMSENSASYPFYINLDSAEGLMLGQHVLIEPDYGQGAVREGIWLDMSYVVTEDNGNSYVWAANKRDRLEKRKVTTGETDEETFTIQIVDGLTMNDRIAWPDETIHEGMPVLTYAMPEEAE